jgi:hypothetical protein
MSCSMQADITKLIVAFRNFSNSPKIGPFLHNSHYFKNQPNVSL